MKRSKTTATEKGRGGTKSGFELPPLVAHNKRAAPINILSLAKKSALIECFTNNGLYREKGYWRGSPEGKRIAGTTVADLSREGMLAVTTTRLHGSAQLTERGNWFARTLIEAANAG